jgi:hypothetical protein
MTAINPRPGLKNCYRPGVAGYITEDFGHGVIDDDNDVDDNTCPLFCPSLFYTFLF